MKTIVFWQNSLSIHQAPLIKNLAEKRDLVVHVVAFADVSSLRRSMGWGDADYGRAHIHVSPTGHVLDELLAGLIDADAHIVSGLGVYPPIVEVSKRLSARSHPKVLVMTEPWDSRGAAGILRSLIARRRVDRVLEGVAAVLTCGTRASTQIARFARTRNVPMYDFGYFVDASLKPSVVSAQGKGGQTELLFVGQMIKRKDPLGLLEAMAGLKHYSWALTLVGDGELRGELERHATRLGLAERVAFKPYLPNDEVRTVIAKSDVLVLPSLHDGWGAVVNEALMEGTRVVVSDAAGASDLVSSDRVGSVFRAGKREELAAVLESILASPDSAEMRVARRSWASVAVSAKAAADYLAEVIDVVPNSVDPPWKRATSLEVP